MQALVSIAMIGLLLVQAAFGCCFGHAARCPAINAAATSDCGHDHDHGQPDTPKPAPHPCGCERVCNGSCTYLTPPKVEIDGRQLVQPLSIALPVLAPDQAAIRSGSWRHGDDWPGTVQPLSQHLFNQLLLN
jgi:hypothetical protein